MLFVLPVRVWFPVVLRLRSLLSSSTVLVSVGVVSDSVVECHCFHFWPSDVTHSLCDSLALWSLVWAFILASVVIATRVSCCPWFR